MQPSISYLKYGISLGNSLDAIGGETAWRNLPLTRPVIQAVADAGVKTVRLPVTWHLHMKEIPDYEIYPQWMSRVKEVVQWILDAGMNVIINSHHDQCWQHPTLETVPDVLPRYIALWKQIAEAFGGLDDRVVFQGLNEPRLEFGENEMDGGTKSVRQAINVLNHAFVRTVRATGGNNTDRWLIVPTYFAQYTQVALEDMEVPRDRHVAVSVHCYDPHVFTFETPGEESTPFFDDRAQQAIRQLFDTLDEYAGRWQTPFILTEFGAVKKFMPDEVTPNDEERAKFVRAMRTEADKRGIPCIWWDNNYRECRNDSFCIINRDTLRVECPLIVEALTQEP